MKPQNLVDLKPILGSKVLVSPGFPWFRSTSGYWVRVLNVCPDPGCVALRPVPAGRHSLRLWSGIVFFGVSKGMDLADFMAIKWEKPWEKPWEKHINLDEAWMERTHYVVHGLLDEQMFALATLDLRLLGAYLWLNS